MSLPIYQRVAVTDAGDVIPGAEYTVINENTGVAAPIYSDRTGATLLTAPYFADSVGTIQFFIAQGTTFRVAASGGVGTYTDRYVYGVAEAVLVQADGNVGIGTSSPSGLAKTLNIDGGAGGSSIAIDGGNNFAVTFVGATVGDPTSMYSNTGFKFATATAKDATGFSEKVRISSSGNVGIGNSDPTVPLDVRKAAGGNFIANFQNTTASTPYGVSIKDAVGGSSGYPLFQVTNSAGSTAHLKVMSGTGDVLAAGNLLVGTTSDFTSGTVDGIIAQGTNKPAAAFSNTASGQIVKFYKGSSLVGNIGTENNNITINTSTTGALQAGGSSQYKWDDTRIYPASTNTRNLGLGTYRWKDVYTINPVNSTSDRTQKQDIQEITTAEHNVAKACKGLLRSFRWIDAVEEKGDDARIHFGIIAQDLQDAFTAEGLDAGRYGMFMSDTWWETQTEVAAVEAVEGVEFVQAVEASEALYSEDGELVSEAVEAVEGVKGVEAVEAKDAYTRTDTFQTLAEAPAGATERTRLGVRYSELLAFIIAAL